LKEFKTIVSFDRKEDKVRIGVLVLEWDEVRERLGDKLGDRLGYNE
jgi:hypothetical protein